LNRTQQITFDWLANSGLDEEELLFEALLRRGFLVFKNEEGIWLGSGSHHADKRVLSCIDGLVIRCESGSSDRIAEISAKQSNRDAILKNARAIISLGEHHLGNFPGGFTQTGPAQHVAATWDQYCKMTWGAKLPVCPIKHKSDLRNPVVPNSLDTGIALLAKVMPLARVATSCSCDGHGIKPANVSFFYPWDGLWAESVFSALRFTPRNSKWTWSDNSLCIEPLKGYGDADILGMLDDIQSFARLFLNQPIVDAIGVARSRLLAAIGDNYNDPIVFTDEAKRQLTSFSFKS